jgi:hypothetical protein
MFFFFKDDKERLEKYQVLESYYTKKPAILSGNGINLLSDNRSWEHLLRNLSEQFQINVRINKEKAFPLIFEELLFRSTREYKETLDSFKQQINNELVGLNNNEYHDRLINLKCSEYLTTNYDYSLERVIDSNFDRSNRNSRETKYSVYRNNIIGENNKIWHIHGELNHGFQRDSVHESIMIGNEHYGDYHRKVHEILKPPGSIFAALENKRDSWPKRFFTHDIHIVGLSLDFSETHLWWILNYRARLQKEFGELPNKIYYHYPSFSEEGNKSKNELFSALNVIPTPTIVQTIDDEKYKRFWDILLSRTLQKLL